MSPRAAAHGGAALRARRARNAAPKPQESHMWIQETHDAVPRTLAALCAAVQAGSQSPEVAAALALAAGGSVGGAIDLLQGASSASSNAGVLPADGKAVASVIDVLREHRTKCAAMGAFYKAQRSLLETAG